LLQAFPQLRGTRMPRVWPAICALSTAFGCMPAAKPPAQPEERSQVVAGVPGALVDLDPIRWQPGQQELQLPVAGSVPRSVLVWVPEAPAPRAVLVLLHGRILPEMARGRSDPFWPARMLVSCLAAPALAALQPLILAPISTTGEWWSRPDTELVLGLVLAARNRWPEAGAHSVISGYSNGGIGSWYFARLYPEYFSAAIPMAFNDSIVGETRLPIYAIQGTKDEQFEFAGVRARIDALIQKGRDVTFDAKYRGTHLAVCSYVPELTRAGRWFEQRVLTRAASSNAP
jgi:hypothetical protein